GRDSNPRYGVTVHLLSKQAPSTARPPLRFASILFDLSLADRPGGIDSGHAGPRPSGALRASKSAIADLSNPRYGVTVHLLSKQAPSTARPPLRFASILFDLSLADRPGGIDSGHSGPRPSGALRASKSATQICRTPGAGFYSFTIRPLRI